MTSILVGFFTWIGNILNSTLPNLNSGGTSNVSSAVAYVVQLISVADYLIPVDTIFEITGLVISYKIAMMAWYVVNWIIRTIRG